MARVPQLEFANVIIRFGDTLEMVDLFEQVVLPAFITTTFSRVASGSEFFLIDVSLELLDASNTNSLAVVGRFLRDTVLTSEQRFDRTSRQVVASGQSMPSAPSALFALRIYDHKLLWLHETGHAPTLKMFEATLRAFLRKTHQAFIKREYEARRKAAKEQQLKPLPTVSAIREEYPPPSVEIVALASQASLEQFIRQFQVLNSVTVEFLIPNAELDNNPLFERIRGQQTRLRSKKTSLSHTSRDGLDKDTTVTEIAPAAQEANSRITLVGKDAQGDTLRGNEDKFRLTVPMPEVQREPSAAGRTMNQSFENLRQRGVITLARLGDRVATEAGRLIARLRR